MTETRHRSGAHRIASTLGPDARALISAARRGDDPSARDRTRVRRALFAAIAGTAVAGGATATASAAAAGGGAMGGATAASSAGAISSASATGAAATSTLAMGTAATSTAATSALATTTAATGTGVTLAGGSLVGSSLAAKVAAIVLAVGAAGGALAVGSISSAPEAGPRAAIEARVDAPVATPVLAARVDAPVVADAPTPMDAVPSHDEPVALVDVEAPVLPAVVPAVVPVPAPVARPGVRAPRAPRIVAPTPAPAVAVAPPVAQLGDEMPLVRSAWAALRDDRPEDALAAVAAHRERFPHGALAPERDAARAAALCAAGRTAEGEQAADAFLSAHPRSPLASRVRAACGR